MKGGYEHDQAAVAVDGNTLDMALEADSAEIPFQNASMKAL
jgi:hypothetical protein